MSATMERQRIFTTPGFLASGDPGIDPLALATALFAGGQRDWIIGDPDLWPKGRQEEDGCRTLRLGARFKFYAIRDDHPQDCLCGCGGGSVVTFLLPDEY